MQIRIADDFYVQHIAELPVAGQVATVTRCLRCGVVAKVDGLAPYGHDGQLVFAPGTYEATE